MGHAAAEGPQDSLGAPCLALAVASRTQAEAGTRARLLAELPSQVAVLPKRHCPRRDSPSYGQACVPRPDPEDFYSVPLCSCPCACNDETDSAAEGGSAFLKDSAAGKGCRHAVWRSETGWQPWRRRPRLLVLRMGA